MISRRLLRIKAMHMLYAFFESENPSLEKFEKELFFSIDKAYALYHYFLQLITEIKDLENEKIEIAKNKYFPSLEEKNPNLRFVENKIILQIEQNKQLNRYLSEEKLTWVNYPELIAQLLSEIKKSEAYASYMCDKEPGYAKDKEFVIFILQHIIPNCENIYEALEEQSIFWNDDIEFVISMIIQTLDKFRESQKENARLLPLFKHEDDAEFVKKLFRKAVLKHDDNKILIDKFTSNWDVERIAFMDIILMELAITEITEISSVPTKVSFNEYIEIAKYYSTNKSSVFINGVLDKIIQHLKSENKINKIGRGLIGE